MSEHLLLTQWAIWCHREPLGGRTLLEEVHHWGFTLKPSFMFSLSLFHTHIHTFLIFFFSWYADRMWSLCFLTARLPSHSLLSWFPYSVSLELECILFYIAYGYGTETPTYFISTFVFSYIQNWKQGIHRKPTPQILPWPQHVCCGMHTHRHAMPLNNNK